jgi:enoyl-CoA hydratase
MSEIIKSDRKDAVATVTVDRGADGNILTLDQLRALSKAFRAAGASDAKAIVLRTAGTDFCRGRDPRGAPAAVSALEVRTNLIAPILDLYQAISEAPQPVIAAVQGAALGFGCALATACDITVASDAARFRLPEMEKNLPPTLAISAMMSRVPRKTLTWMVYSMHELDAQTAWQRGIVSQVVPAAQLDSVFAALVADITSHSREALVAVKDYMRTALGMEASGAADYAGNLLAAVLSSSTK